VSLRARLAWTLALAIVGVSLVVAAVSVTAIDRALRTTLDQRLRTTAAAVASLVDVHHGRLRLDDEDREQMTSALAGMDGAVFTCDGASFTATSSAIPNDVSAVRACSLQRAVVSGQAGGHSLRIATAPVSRGTSLFGTVAVWQGSDFIGDFDRDALVAVGLTALIGGFIVIALSLVLARRALEPLDRLGALATEIEAHDLSRRLRAGGDDELGRLGSAFDRMLDRLEDAFTRQRRFAADASHELRAPLAVMRAEAEVTLAKERPPAEYQRALETIVGEVERIDGLVDTLLVAARADSSKLAFEPVDLGAVVRAVEQRFASALQSRELTLETHVEDASVLGDAAAIERALSAVVHNAVDFARSRVTVDMSVTGGEACVSVRDDGSGFTDSGLAHAADRFWRADPSRRRGGTGLGMSIADAVVRAHGGRFEWANAAAGGACVSMYLRSS